MLVRLRELVAANRSFAFETTRSGLGHVRFLSHCRTAGYQVVLIYLWLPSLADALARVARRVARGGHSIPDDVVIRRYSAGLKNMRHHYLPLADAAVISDNSDGKNILIAERRPGTSLVIHDAIRWQLIEDATR